MSRARRLTWILALAIVCAALGRVVGVARVQLAAPFDLISEGPHLTTVEAIRNGINVYAPASYEGPPYTLTPYTPLYHAVIAALPQDPDNPFRTGRMVAAFCMVGAGAVLLFLGRRYDALPFAVMLFGLFFAVRTVTGNTMYMRSDTLGLMLAVWAVTVVSLVPTRRGAVGAAAVLAALAVATKQSFAAAPLTGFLWLCARDWRLALRFALVGSVVGAVLALAASAIWGTGFWYCVTLPITTYPRDWEAFRARLDILVMQPVVIYLLVVAVGATLYAVVRPPKRAATGLFFLYMIAAWVLQLTVLTGIGCAEHYLIESVLATAMWTVVATAGFGASRMERVLGAGVLAAGALALVIELRDAPYELYAYTTPTATAEHVRRRADVEAALQRLGVTGRRFLNLSTSVATHDFPGAMTVNDPFMFFMLWDTGTVSIEPLRAALAAHAFDAVFVAPSLTSAANQEPGRPLQDVIIALFRHYRFSYGNELVGVLTPIP